jgi:hypothetical protein
MHMARLEEMVNPSELLSAIKSGVMKAELLKRYKTTDQELAMMLLPLYRRGEMTKEEFNNFFNGIPISGDEVAAADDKASQEKYVEEPPSEIRRAFSKLFHRKSAAETKPASHEEPVPEKLIPPPPKEISGEPENPPSPAAQEVENSLDLDLREIEEEEESIVEEAPKTVEIIKMADSATLQDLVDTIFAKITAIENRVAALEKKVGSD